MSHPQGVPRRQPPQGRSSRGNWTQAARVVLRMTLSSGGTDVRGQSPPDSTAGAPPPYACGAHRVKGWELEAGHRPLQEELLRGGEGQAQVEGKLGVRAEVRQGAGWARLQSGCGRGLPGGPHRRSLSFSAREPSWRGGQRHLGRTRDAPAASGTRVPRPAISPKEPRTSPTPGALTSHEDAVPNRDGHTLIGLGRDGR